MRDRPTATRAALTFVGSALALTGCTTSSPDSTADQRIAAAADSAGAPAPGGVIRRGDSFATMAQQYTVRPSPYAATGARAWVNPAPEPAFVASGPPPPADPPAPAPAAVANRQPAAANAAEIIRPEAAAPGNSEDKPDPELRTAGLALFNNYSCSTCHALADAGAGGSIGPSLDNNPRLSKEYTVTVIANGSGAMPSFGGQMSDDEIETLAQYIVQVARK